MMSEAAAGSRWWQVGCCLWLCLLHTTVIAPPSCDVHIIQSELIGLNGTFTSYNYGHGNYGPNLQCVYKFIARAGYRVHISFKTFALTGTPDRCSMDYIDIYSELADHNVELIRFNMSGRYCGSVSPKRRISLHQIIVIVFHTRANTPGAPGFAGSYEFIPEDRYIVGTPSSDSQCGYTITAHHDRHGTLISPTYPGAYPPNFYCWYWLTGQAGQRIRLYLNDFDLYFGGDHCPYDSVTIYDGSSNRAPIIHKLCGMQQALTLYSVSNNMFVELNTTRPPDSEHRGFQLDYMFSGDYVNVAQMIQGGSGISHMRGTECDIRVQSNVQTTHQIWSPGFPGLYPPHTECTYIIDGLQGMEKLEKVYLRFETFNIPAPPVDPARLAALAAGIDINGMQPFDEYDSPTPAGSNNAVDLCPGNFLGVYNTEDSIKEGLSKSLRGPWEGPMDMQLQSPYPSAGSIALVRGFNRTQREPPARLDCPAWPYFGGIGVRHFEQVESSGARMLLVLKTQEVELPDGIRYDNVEFGFKAHVEFETDFGIPGEPIGSQNLCQFRFMSGKTQYHTIHSPRFPANYPLQTNCTYLLVGRPGERVRLWFDQFTLSHGRSEQESCNDYVLIYDQKTDGIHEEGVLSAKYCPRQQPGPLVSRLGYRVMKVVFVSDIARSATGFEASFDFRRQKQNDVPGETWKADNRSAMHWCGGQLGDGPSGNISSPGDSYDVGWVCTWEVRVAKGYRVMIRPGGLFNIEGTMHMGSSQCLVTVIRVWANGPDKPFTHELCGIEEAAVPAIISESNVLRLSFLTSPRSVNSLKGFNFTWTKLKDITATESCKADEIRCDGSRPHFCVHESLRCNGVPNCGENDRTDEVNCALDTDDSHSLGTMMALVTAGLLVLVLLLICTCVLLKQQMNRKFEKDRHKRRAERRSRSRTKAGGNTHGAPTIVTPSQQHPPPGAYDGIQLTSIRRAPRMIEA